MANTTAPEEEIDYSWHPTDDEYVSPLTSEQWAELFKDTTFAESDAIKAVICLRDYGEPATFQQLSIKYRGTMGRYRRWLGEAAQAAGERFGVEAPQQNQFGMDEWWPLLYQTRSTGKPGAGIFEMQLRPEVIEAFEQIAADELKAKRAENARQLQRIEQLERARQAERQRAAERAAIRAAAAAQEAEEQPEEPQEEAVAEEQAPDGAGANAPEVPVQDVVANDAVPQTPAIEVEDDVAEDAPAHDANEEAQREDLPALRAFLLAMARKATAAKAALGGAPGVMGQMALEVAAPVDYALRYAERLRYAIALIRDAVPGVTAAALARAIGDESVQELQDVLNGQSIPTFAYLDRLRDTLFVGIDRLEAADGREDALPAFVSLCEVCGVDKTVETIVDAGSSIDEIAFVVDDSRNRRTSVIVRFSDLCCALLTRDAVSATARKDEVAELDAFMAMLDELDTFAHEHDVARTNRQVSAAEWDALVAGNVWPGALLRS